ncbi:MAG: glycosyltransferase family 4 protein [Pseudomonadota bacterium]
MKIAVIRQRYNPYGGAERFVERALSTLAEQGAEVTLVTRDWSGAALQSGYRQISLATANALSGSLAADKSSETQRNSGRSRRFWQSKPGRLARDQQFAAFVQQTIAADHYDIVQAHERIPGCMVFRAGDGVHAAWLDHLRQVRGAWGRFGLLINPYHRYVLAAERALFAHPNLRAIICNSRMVRAELIRYYAVPESKLRLIYNGVDPALFHPGLASIHRARCRAEHGIAPTVPLLLFVGNGFERKGLPQLLRAFAARRTQAAHLVVVGGDKKMAAMQKLAAKLGIAQQVLFTGAQKNVEAWYGAADAFVLPTLYDPFPNAALEAMASGLPILSSSTCGAAEFVRDERDGFVCDALDIAALTHALDQLIARPSLTLAERSELSRKTLPYSLTQMAQQLSTLYEELLR